MTGPPLFILRRDGLQAFQQFQELANSNCKLKCPWGYLKFSSCSLLTSFGIFSCDNGTVTTCDFTPRSCSASVGFDESRKSIRCRDGGCDKNRYDTQATRTKRWNWIFLALSRRRDWQGEINLIMFDKMWVLWISTTDSDDVVRGVYINSSYRGRHSNRPLVSLSLDHNNSGESLYSPLLAPSGPRRMVHSSIIPNGVNNCLTSSSVCCLLSMPTKSFRSTQ